MKVLLTLALMGLVAVTTTHAHGIGLGDILKELGERASQPVPPSALTERESPPIEEEEEDLSFISMEDMVLMAGYSMEEILGFLSELGPRPGRPGRPGRPEVSSEESSEEGIDLIDLNENQLKAAVLELMEEVYVTIMLLVPESAEETDGTGEEGRSRPPPPPPTTAAPARKLSPEAKARLLQRMLSMMKKQE